MLYKYAGKMSVFSINHGSVKVAPPGCPNAGVKMSLIVDDANKDFGVCSK